MLSNPYRSGEFNRVIFFTLLLLITVFVDVQPSWLAIMLVIIFSI